MEKKILAVPFYGMGWGMVEPLLFKVRGCLMSGQTPGPDPACDYCAYRKASAALAAQSQRGE